MVQVVFSRDVCKWGCVQSSLALMTFVGFDAFLSALMHLGSGWHPSFEKIWPKKFYSSFTQEFVFASRRPLSESAINYNIVCNVLNSSQSL